MIMQNMGLSLNTGMDGDRELTILTIIGCMM